MGGESKRRVWWMVQLLAAATYYLQTCVRAADSPERCMFIFGDSLSDPGNNNLFPTTAKANYFPYGIDFPGGVATGRFCNKFDTVDYIAKFIGISLIPPFANTSGSDILKGVNYASGAAGILPDTAIQMALYELGARKFTLTGIGRIGCVPYIRNTNNGECVQVLNEAGSLFSEKLKSLIDQFNSKYSGEASFVFVNSTAISTQNPAFLALKNQKDSCCETVSSSGLCARNERPCENRDEHVYWDGLHRTDAAHKIYALSQYNASNPNFAYPMDINHLLSLSLSLSPAA
ncbi:hypothetical protein K1719_008483 [Acacia pycnantha]|nr:hypothetical protein K1719_008483 [Acacia pycnantha]